MLAGTDSKKIGESAPRMLVKRARPGERNGCSWMLYG